MRRRILTFWKPLRRVKRTREAPAVAVHEPSHPPHDWKDDVLNSFSDWLDELTAAERMEIGTEADAECECPAPTLYEFFAALSALRQEVKLQGRSTQNVGRTVEALTDAIRSEAAEKERVLARAAADPTSGISAARKEAEGPLVVEILDLRESIALTSDAADRIALPHRPWRRRTLRALDRLRAAQRMLMDRADDVLRRLNLLPVAKPGDTFDSACMRAAAVSTTGAASGTVLSVFRQGYRHEGRIVRVAEVEVEK